ncbi:hypothetical protein ABIE06_004667 [Pantoea dispersa]|jgi:hypothetical protein|uniref:hypothetical protein n=1 Tax=Pantoea dispersa TaxID=59814 RepID=UPI003D1966E4
MTHSKRIPRIVQIAERDMCDVKVLSAADREALTGSRLANAVCLITFTPSSEDAAQEEQHV